MLLVAVMVMAGTWAVEAGIPSLVSQKRAKRVDDEAILCDIVIT